MWRSLTVLPVVLVLALGVAGCGDETEATVTRPVPPVAAKPSAQPVSDAPPLGRRTIASGFQRAAGLVEEPGPRGRVLVLEQAGTARWLDGHGPAPGPPFLDLRQSVKLDEEQGLLGLAFLPGYRKDPRIAVHYNDLDGNTRVDLYRLHNGFVDPLSREPILAVEQPYGNHNGGEMVVGRDGQLYLGLGDGGSAYDPRQNGQNLDSLLGKVLRYDLRNDRAPRGAAAVTPSDETASASRWRIVAYGLRNPWRISFDKRTDDLWVADAGRDAAQEQTEEIDRLPASRIRDASPPTNFGWAAFEGVRDQPNRELNTTGPLAWPIASYTSRSGCAVTGGMVVRGPESVPASLRDRYLFGDFCSGRVWSIPADAKAPVALRNEGLRIPRQTSYLQDRRGRVLVSTLGGGVVQLLPARAARDDSAGRRHRVRGHRGD